MGSEGNHWSCCWLPGKYPDLAIGDGALGFWAALREEFGDVTEQRWWCHNENVNATGPSDRPGGQGAERDAKVASGQSQRPFP